jgi:hypothetical protein
MSSASSAEKSLQTQCSESGSAFGEQLRCQNPTCANPLPPKRKHASRKLYCSTQCTQSGSIINRAKQILSGLSDDELLRVMRNG